MDQKELVTYKEKTSQTSSNVYFLEVLNSNEFLLGHPLAPGIYKKAKSSELNVMTPVPKDSLELLLSYCFSNLNILDFNNKAKVESLCFFYFIKKYLSSAQKRELSCVAGSIASVQLNNSMEAACNIIKNNVALLDEFNLMWYIKLEKLITKETPILSQKQRASIFNMAGFILAQLQTQKVTIEA